MKRWYICILLLLLLAVPVTGRAEETPKPELQGEPRLEVVDVAIEQGVIINIELKAQNCRMAGYYFGVIDKEPKPDNYDWVETSDLVLRMTKWPDTYYFWVRDTEGRTYGPTKIELPLDYYHT